MKQQTSRTRSNPSYPVQRSLSLVTPSSTASLPPVQTFTLSLARRMPWPSLLGCTENPHHLSWAGFACRSCSLRSVVACLRLLLCLPPLSLDSLAPKHYSSHYVQPLLFRKTVNNGVGRASYRPLGVRYQEDESESHRCSSLQHEGMLWGHPRHTLC